MITVGRYTYGDLDFETSGHLVGGLPAFVDEVVFDVEAFVGGDGLVGHPRHALDVVFLEHAEHVHGGDVEQLDAGFGEEDANFEGVGVGGCHGGCVEGLE